MALKKSEFNDDEVPIFEEALVYKGGKLADAYVAC
jgi:hypothetical protein